MKKIKKLTLLGLFISVALVVSFIETLIPPIIPVPGIKIGLANIITVLVLYKFGLKSAITVSILRVALANLLFGTVLTLAYSFAGALLSLTLMYTFKRLGLFSTVGVSIIGGVSHNTAQIIVACILLQTSQISYYLPILFISGTVTGTVIGILGALLIKRLNFKERF